MSLRDRIYTEPENFYRHPTYYKLNDKAKIIISHLDYFECQDDVNDDSVDVLKKIFANPDLNRTTQYTHLNSWIGTLKLIVENDYPLKSIPGIENAFAIIGTSLKTLLDKDYLEPFEG